MNRSSRTGSLIGCLFLYPFVVWAALLLAQSLGGGLPEILQKLAVSIEQPLQIQWTERSFVCILICTGVYLAALFIHAANRGQTRDGAEHGSAAWASPREVNRLFCQKENKILTQNVRLGLDTHKHRRNLNVLVIGGSGAAKTRGFVKPSASVRAE